MALALDIVTFLPPFSPNKCGAAAEVTEMLTGHAFALRPSSGAELEDGGFGIDYRLPTERFFSERTIGKRVTRFAETRWQVGYGAADQRGDPVDAEALTAAHIQGATVGNFGRGVECEQVGADNVGDVREIAGLLAV